MDDVQSWWEVPAIAHFCYAFRDAFNLSYFEIGELEAAILNMQDPEMSISLEQLVIKLLQGCFDEKDVRSDNWEEKLIELFEETSDDENPVKNAAFHFLSPRLKVEVLYKLCQFRLDSEGALDIIKDIPAEFMKASCVGKDSQNNLYWYFCDERLYKEDPSKKPKKTDQPVKSAASKNSTSKNAKRSTTRERKPVINNESNSPWTIVCYNTSDWETLIKGFSKSKNTNEKELVNQVTTKYLPLLKDVVSEKDRLLRKRYLEFAPKRVSSRISKVQAQRKMEDQKAAEAAEEKRIQQEEERKKKEDEDEKNKKEARKKRAEEREKVIYGRLSRAKQREMMRGCSTDSESDEEEETPTYSRSQRACRSSTRSTKQNANNNVGTDSKSESDEESFVYNNVSKRASSSSKSSSRRQSTNSENSDNNCDYLRGSRNSSKSSPSYDSGRPEQRLVRASEDIGSYSLNRTLDSSKRKVATISYHNFPENKRLKQNEISYNMKTVKSIPSKDSNISCYKENNWYSNTCKKVTSSPAIIRFDFIKPPAKSQS